MQIVRVNPTEMAFLVSWDTGENTEVPFIWLRDNDPQELHPQTHERTFDLTSVALSIKPDAYELQTNSERQSLRVVWPNKSEASIYSAQWLYAHRPGQRRADVTKIEMQAWRADTMHSPPRFHAEECRDSSQKLLELLQTLYTSGIVLLEGLQDDPKSGHRFGDLIGFKRRTNFGTTFEVASKPDPNNLAYTALALPLHTDLPNQQAVPGLQFLHCYKNSAVGGASVFADAKAIVDDFRIAEPQHFKTLVETDVPWRFHDQQDDIRCRRPVIGLDEFGQFTTLTFNAHIADVPDFDAEIMYSFYAAFQKLMLRIRQEQYQLRYAMRAGEMVIFDNQRTLHGRESFDADSGERHLCGFYIDHNEVRSRMRTLHSKLSS